MGWEGMVRRRRNGWFGFMDGRIICNESIGAWHVSDPAFAAGIDCHAVVAGAESTPGIAGKRGGGTCLSPLARLRRIGVSPRIVSCWQWAEEPLSESSD